MVRGSTRNTTLNGEEVTAGVESFGGYVRIASTATIVPSRIPGNMLSPKAIGDYAAHRVGNVRGLFQADVLLRRPLSISFSRRAISDPESQ
mgnify:CR=1 FL=1